jgi:hypothetical protein
VRVLVAAALVLACLAVFLVHHRTRRAEQLEPAAALRQVEELAPSEESVPAAAPERPSRGPPRTVDRQPAASPPPTIETFETGNLHSTVMDMLVRTRQDAVDECRDRFKLPRVEELLASSTVIANRLPSVREAALQQSILFQISLAKDGCHLESAQVIDTWVEFPAPDGTLRRASLADASLDRCVERVLQGARAEANASATPERFWIQGRAGEAVYDLP